MLIRVGNIAFSNVKKITSAIFLLQCMFSSILLPNHQMLLIADFLRKLFFEHYLMICTNCNLSAPT